MIKNYLSNLFMLLRGNRLLRPLNIVYYLTTQCNLNCIYCEDFGSRRNHEAVPPVPFEDACKILRVIRSGSDHLILTGGEPLLVPYVDELVTYAKNELRFRNLSILSNASLLSGHTSALSYIDRLIISLDTTDAVLWSSITQTPVSLNQSILDNIKMYSRDQKKKRFNLIVNCVITPATIPNVEEIIAFCISNDILFSFSPQSVNNLPQYELLVSKQYQELIDRFIDMKSRGAPILASNKYLISMRNYQPYSCYPELIPRIWPDGSLIYPCRPIEKAGDMHGGKPCNLLEVVDWNQAIKVAETCYGHPPRLCTSCFQQCYAEPSLMQTNPISLILENLRFRSMRRGTIPSYAPG